MATTPAATGRAGEAAPDRFDSAAAWRLLREQVELGPRPAGSPASRRLAERLRGCCRGGRYQAGARRAAQRDRAVPGRGPGFVVVGAHYDTKDIPGFVGANDGASGTAVAVQLARTIKPRTLRRTIVFVLFDGEESPRGTPDAQFARAGLRGSRVAARSYRDARAMVLLDFVGDKALSIPREGLSSPGSGAGSAPPRARRAPAARFPDETSGSVARRPHPVPGAGGALDRPDRLQLHLLAPALRRPVRGVRAQP